MDRYAVSGSEPSLREVLDDPIVRLVMARDKVSRADLMRMIEMHRGHRAAELPKTDGCCIGFVPGLGPGVDITFET